MNRPPSHKLFSAAAKGLLCALLMTLLLPAAVSAQPKSPARWLLVFDLSPAMKKRLPATEAVLKNFFATGADGRLQAGDNIGVWTCDQKLHTGQFPLATWDSQQAVTLTTNLAAFLESRAYAGDSQLAALQPLLGRVIADSERLTVIVFCDGGSEISGTPYDLGISQNFLDGRAERKKNSQPFVVLIRTLSGKYVGCTVNFPPGDINIPLFLAPVPATTNPPPPPPVVAPVKPVPVVVPDLIINGTNVSQTDNAPTPAAPLTTNPIPVPAPVVVKTSPPAVQPVAIPPPTNSPAAMVAAPTNAANVTTNINDGTNQKPRHLVLIGVGLLAVAVVVLLLVFRPGRRPETSLISSSMQDDPDRK